MFRSISLFMLLALSATSLHAGPPPASYRIAGIVVDSVTGQPLEGAEVNISPVANLEDQQTFLTSSGGRFFFANVQVGKYRLVASRRGYAMQAFHEHEGFSTAIVVGPGLDSEHIRFPLTPSSVITGVVTDDWGDPVRDARVLLFQQSMFDGSRSLRNINQAITDDQGRYRFAHLRSGTYSVAVYANPWYTQSQMQIQVVEGNINLSDTQVIEQAGEGLTFHGPRRLSSISLDPLFDVIYPITFFPNASSVSEATRFALVPGAAQTADIQLRAVPSVHLRVRVQAQITPVAVTSETADSEGDAQEGISTTSEVESSPDVALALKIGDSYTDQIEPARKQIAPGIVELSGIPPGQVEVSLNTGSMLTGPDDSVVSHGKTLNLSGDTELDLSAQGDAAGVTGVVLSSKFPSPPASAQTSTVQTSGDPGSPDQAVLGRLLEEASMNVAITFRSLRAGESYNSTISSRGKFTFAASILPAGSYEVEFAPQSGLRVASLEATGATVSGHTIEITAGQPVNVTVHAAEANCTLSGIALKNGKPVAGAMVLLVPQDPGHDMSLYHRDQSDSDGSFTMPLLFPGRYILLAIENGWALEWADPKVMFQYLPAGQPLELKPNASLTFNAKVQ
ncbi:MAG TPA: carboxypeptidase regulatory-like domain-containing protein [Candidatus Acidoferrum sp.]|nr:carboxypeptidase regulatory-like domain-containing protein [Candidatus Acidoferrum sp.]